MPDIALMVNASCDLPKDIIDRLPIICVPNRVTLGSQTLIDDRDPTRSLEFFDFEFDSGKEEASIAQPGAEGYLEAVKQYAVLKCDELLVLTPLRDLAQMFDQVVEGTMSVATSALDQRMAAGRRDIFRIHVEDSRSLFAANGVVAWDLAEGMAAGQPMQEVRERAKLLSANAYGYYLANNLRYIVNRARDSRDKPNAMVFALGNWLDVKPIVRRKGSDTGTVAKVRSFDGAASKLFARLAKLIVAGQLITPRILLSYGGSPAALRKLPGFDDLVQTAQDNGVLIAASTMSMSTGLFLGRQALTVGLVAHPHDF